MRVLPIVLLIVSSSFPLIAQSWNFQTSNTTNLLQSVWFIDSQNGWTVGDVGTSLRTTNGGASWAAFVLTGLDLEDIAFADNSTGLIVGDNGLIFRTTDGGSSWSSVAGATTSNLRTVAFGSGGMVYAAGRDGAIVRSTDLGGSWSNVSFGTTRYEGAAAYGPQRAWIVGRNGVIIATTNGGALWTTQNSTTSSDLQTAFFISEVEGWAGGQNSTLLYTSNGGATWVPRNTGINVGVDAVYFVNSNEGWAVGDFGAIFRTVNGGLNWTTENSGTSNGLNGVFFVSSGEGWAVGDLGTILHRTGPTAVHQQDFNGQPQRVRLSQNYPNPFNPTTLIDFTVTESEHVSLRVFNVLGHEVATLASGVYPAGTHMVRFDAANVPSGIYFYRLDLGDGSIADSKRMTIIK